MTIQDILIKYWERAQQKENTPLTRKWLKNKIDFVFEYADKHNIERPVDFNISISQEGDIEVYFSKDYTKV